MEIRCDFKLSEIGIIMKKVEILLSRDYIKEEDKKILEYIKSSLQYDQLSEMLGGLF